MSSEDLAEEQAIEDSLGLSHELIQFKLNGRINKYRSATGILDFKRAKFKKLREVVMEVDWTEEHKDLNVEEAWN